MKYYIYTYVVGLKFYVRKISVCNKYIISVSMFTTNRNNAKNFISEKTARCTLAMMGIGYRIEIK